MWTNSRLQYGGQPPNDHKRHEELVASHSQDELSADFPDSVFVEKHHERDKTVDGHNDLPSMPQAIAKIYWQAYASFDSVDDPRLKRALFGVMNAIHREVLPTLRVTVEGDEAQDIW